MFRVLTLLIGLVLASETRALTNQEMIKNLETRFSQLSGDRGSLIKSYTTHSQSYIYDQALAIITFAKARDQDSARKLLKGLSSLQMADGSLYFSYYLNGIAGSDKKIAGAISWVALAAIHYQSAFKSKEFLVFNQRILTYLHSEIRPVSNLNALRFSPNSDIAALEHNLDAFAAFFAFSEINDSPKWKKVSEDLKAFSLAMWDKKNSHFWSGVDLKSGSINKSEIYLDNQTWSLLALDKNSLKEINPKEALELNCELFQVKDEGVHGFMDSKPTRYPASDKFVWSEGTLGQVLAMKKVSFESCNGKRHKSLFSRL